MRSCVDATVVLLEKVRSQRETSSRTPATASAVESLRSEYVAAFNSGDAAKLASLYSQDAVYMPVSGERIEEREAIEAHFESDFRRGMSELKVEPQETKQIGDAFYDSGAYSMMAAGPTEQKMPVRGSYVVLVQPTDDGKLQIKHQIANMESRPGSP
jgi:uncharacterized protein (TIGR02246 family)